MICTVADTSVVLSTSVTVTAGSTAVTGSFSVYERGVRVVVTTGRSLTGATVTTRVAATLAKVPSSTVKLTVRGALLGFSLEFEYTTARRAASKPATDAGPVSVSVPLSTSQPPVIPPASANDSTSSPIT